MLTLVTALSIAHAGPTHAALSTTATTPRTVVAPGKPMQVYLAMKNRTDQRLYFDDHTESACFVEKFAEITMKPAAAKKPLPDCTVSKKAVMPGAVVGMTVDLTQVFELTEAKYSLDVKWKDGGPDIYSPMEQHLGPIRVIAPFTEERVEKGGIVFLPDRSQLQFNKHVFKKAKAAGEQPGVEIHFLHIVPGEGEFEKTTTVWPGKTSQFDIGAYRFDLVDYQFEQFMNLVGFEVPKY